MLGHFPFTLPHEFVDEHRRQLGELVLAAQRTFLFHYYREAYSSSSSTPNRMRRSRRTALIDERTHVYARSKSPRVP
jgi:hypothetical protein